MNRIQLDLGKSRQKLGKEERNKKNLKMHPRLKRNKSLWHKQAKQVAKYTKCIDNSVTVLAWCRPRPILQSVNMVCNLTRLKKVFKIDIRCTVTYFPFLKFVL